MSNSDFYAENSHALPDASIVTRDSLGTLAVSILSSRTDFANVANYEDLVRELHEIVNELHAAYHALNI